MHYSQLYVCNNTRKVTRQQPRTMWSYHPAGNGKKNGRLISTEQLMRMVSYLNNDVLPLYLQFSSFCSAASTYLQHFVSLVYFFDTVGLVTAMASDP